jgi:hypothetical protein
VEEEVEQRRAEALVRDGAEEVVPLLPHLAR